MYIKTKRLPLRKMLTVVLLSSPGKYGLRSWDLGGSVDAPHLCVPGKPQDSEPQSPHIERDWVG